MATSASATVTIAASATTAAVASVRASTGVTPGLASSAKAGVSGDLSGGDSSIGDCSICNGDHGSTGDSACSVVGVDGNGSIGDGSNDDTGGTGGDCGGGNVSKGFRSSRRKSNASVALADRAGKPRPNRAVSTEARAINIAQ
jgi:hypothetical protein